MPLAAGTRLGRYEILKPLGSGGMGEVYRARDSRLGRDIALKVLPAEVSADPDRLARFENEARTVASLNHPNIVTLHSIEDEAGTRFLTMELVEGQGLEHNIAPGGLPIERVIELGTGLALWGIAAVEAAEGRSERAVAISAAAQALSERAGVVIEHPMDPGVVERIEALKATIPKVTLDGLVAKANALTPADVLLMVT